MRYKPTDWAGLQLRYFEQIASLDLFPKTVRQLPVRIEQKRASHFAQ